MEMAGLGVIPSLWEKTISSTYLSTLAERADSSYMSLYTNYDSDEHGEYTYVTGVKTDAAPSTLQEGAECFSVPGKMYARVTTPQGPRPPVLIETWRNIWLLPPSNPGGRRAFENDFEVYDERAANPQDSQIDIYLSFRE